MEESLLGRFGWASNGFCFSDNVTLLAELKVMGELFGFLVEFGPGVFLMVLRFALGRLKGNQTSTLGGHLGDSAGHVSGFGATFWGKVRRAEASSGNLGQLGATCWGKVLQR